MWVPCYDGNLFLMTLEAVELAVELSNVEDFDFVIATARQEPVSINGVPAHLVDRGIVSMNFVDSAASLSWVPNLHVLVLAASQDE